jgi:anaerobic selenocysteine-containing dehydrogenase
MSQTAASADEWIPCKPGTEGAFALSLVHVILRDQLRPASIPPAAIGGWAQGLPDYAPEKAASLIGVSAATLTRIAHEAAANAPAVVLIGGAATAHTNGSLNAVAVNALNVLLGSVGKPGGVLFSATVTQESELLRILQAPLDTFVKQIQSNPASVQVLLLYNANPVFATPAAWGVRDAFEKIPFIASFGSFIDETSALADLILPDHSPLESWLDDAPPSGSTRTVVSAAEPAMHPIHDTRAMADVLLDVAHQLGGDFDKALPWKTYEEAIEAEFAALYKEKGAKTAKDSDEFWKKAREQGGWWSAEETASPIGASKAGGAPVKITAAAFDGDANEFPFHFLPFASQLFYDGSLAHLPWMQETPDPLSTVMWGTWVEINPKTAEKLAIRQGDLLEVASQHGKLRAPALVTPGIAPDVVAMPVGQGHENFTRYATGRGANPISILAPMQVAETSSLAWAATRVKVSAVGHGKLVLFGGSLTEAPAQPR